MIGRQARKRVCGGHVKQKPRTQPGLRRRERKREDSMHSRKTTTKLVAAVAAPCVALVASGSLGLAAELSAQEKKLVEGAKKEGAVTLLNPIFSDRTGERLGEAFKKHYGLGDGFKRSSPADSRSTSFWSARPDSLTKPPSAMLSLRSTAPIGRTTKRWRKRPASTATILMSSCRSPIRSSRCGTRPARA
jgi:hypothetical protein